MKLSLFFALYDCWIGAYWDSKKRILYICPLPCCVVKIERKRTVKNVVTTHEFRVVWYTFMGTFISIKEPTLQLAMEKALAHIKTYGIAVDHDETQIWPKGMTGAPPLIARIEDVDI